MRRTFILLIVVIVSNGIYSQIEYGIHYRLGKSNLLDQNNTGTLNSRNSYCLGFDVQKKILKRYLMRMEINYETKGAYYNIRGTDFILPYLTVPMYFGVNLFNDIIRIMPGLYLATTYKSIGYKASTVPPRYYLFNRFDWGIAYCFEFIPVKFKNYKFKIDHSLSYGLTSSYDTTNIPSITNDHSNLIRNYKADFGLSLSIEF